MSKPAIIQCNNIEALYKNLEKSKRELYFLFTFITLNLVTFYNFDFRNTRVVIIIYSKHLY